MVTSHVEVPKPLQRKTSSTKAHLGFSNSPFIYDSIVLVSRGLGFVT